MCRLGNWLHKLPTRTFVADYVERVLPESPLWDMERKLLAKDRRTSEFVLNPPTKQRRPDRPERSDRPDRPARLERPERADRPERKSDGAVDDGRRHHRRRQSRPELTP